MRIRRRRRYWQTSALAAGLLSGASWAWAQPPYLPIGPAPLVEGPHESAERDPLSKRLHDYFIGRPDMFYEPPPGYYVRNTIAMMRTKADPHRFTLYQTDFLPGTNRLSPSGAA